jgi:flagellar hook-length control protein FliK
VVVTLDTTHLQRVRIDLLLGRKQLNCQVVVEEAAVADLLRQQLPELQAALESTGLRVNALGVRHAAAKATAAPLDSLRQVDVWL